VGAAAAGAPAWGASLAAALRTALGCRRRRQPRGSCPFLCAGGGTAVVYEAHDTQAGRQVALKVMDLAASSTAAAAARRELQCAAALRCEHVVRLFDCFADTVPGYGQLLVIVVSLPWCLVFVVCGRRRPATKGWGVLAAATKGTRLAKQRAHELPRRWPQPLLAPPPPFPHSSLPPPLPHSSLPPPPAFLPVGAGARHGFAGLT
jgi:hypothetical protein